MFLEASAMTGEGVDECFLKAAKPSPSPSPNPNPSPHPNPNPNPNPNQESSSPTTAPSLARCALTPSEMRHIASSL